jgi:adenine-specific DNA-methyltransferase
MPSERARRLRKDMTDAERLLWRHLRNRQVGGWKFRRQHPIGPFIVDFVCIEKRVIIELDGGQHARNVEADAKRSAYLEQQGYRLLRFWNNEVFQHFEAVCTMIFSALSEDGDCACPSPSPSPQRGEGTFLLLP